MSERKRRRSDQPAPRYQESSGSGSGDSDVEFVHDSDESPFKDEEEAEEEEEWGTPSRSKRKSVESKQKKEPVKKQSQKKASTKAKASSVKKEIKDVKKQEASAKKAREKKPVSPKKKESRVSLMLDSSDSENDDWQMGSKTPKQSSIISSSSEEEERKKTGRKTKVDTLDEGGEGERKTVLEGTDALSPEDLIQVQVMREQEVAVCIEEVMVKCLESILRGKGFEYLIPSRAASNQVYLADQDRIGLKKSKMTSRTFVNAREVQKATYTTRILELIHNILMKGIHITKRDLFYTDVKLFQKQENSDTILDDVACMLGCTRTSLNVVASEKGLVVGRLQFEEDGDEINCSRMGVGGKGIPPMIDRVTNLRSDAEFILLVEKDAAFMRLSEDRFYNKMKCIIVTAKGQPDVATRMFLKRLRHELQLPVLALVDSDPYGLKILSVYMSGSKNMSYDSASLTCPDIKWLGVRPSDLDRYKIPPECRLKMTEADKKTGEAMLKEDFIKKNPAWVKELQLMLRTGEKAEIQALSNFGFQYLTETYLPEKISQKDFI